mgnify:CR=1 FL=1
MGIPREKIPWYPTINAELCINCGNCLEFCEHNVFEEGETIMKVVNPYNCVVGCRSCRKDCPVDALSFPTKEELLAMLKKAKG